MFLDTLVRMYFLQPKRYWCLCFVFDYQFFYNTDVSGSLIISWVGSTITGVVSAAVALTSSNFICVATISLVADFDVYSNTSGEATWFVLFHKRRKMP